MPPELQKQKKFNEISVPTLHQIKKEKKTFCSLKGKVKKSQVHSSGGPAAETQGSCTSTRAAGCSLKGSAQILQLEVDQCGLHKGDGTVLDDGKDVQGEPARERNERLVSCRQARQQHWRNKGVTEQERHCIVSVVLMPSMKNHECSWICRREGGHLVGIANTAFLEQAECEVTVISWHTGKLARVARSLHTGT